MSRPSPSGNTVSTVSTSPLRIRDSRLFGSARSSGTQQPPMRAAEVTTADARVGSAAILAGIRARGKPRLLPVELDGHRRDQKDQKNEAEDSHRVPAGREWRQIVERRRVVEANEQEDERREDDPVHRLGYHAQQEQRDEGAQRDIAVVTSEERISNPAAVE